MICLTGDTHHDGLNTNEQLWLRKQGDEVSEVDITAEYVKRCEAHRVKCTIYVTGRTLAGQWKQFEPVASSPDCEVGGHTFDALPRSRFSRLKARLTGGVSCSHAGGYPFRRAQERDVKRMCAVAEERLGTPIVSWRSHGFVRDEHTDHILYAHGIRYISDELTWEKTHPDRLPGGLVSHPLNVIMDHDHIYHAHRSHEYVQKQQQNWTYLDDPVTESYDVETWGDRVLEQLGRIEAAGGVATVLAHPICMYVADRFQTFERLLAAFAESQTIFARETGDYVVHA